MLSVYVLVALTAITQSTSSDGQASVEASQADEALSPSGIVKRPSPIPKGNPGLWVNTNDYPSIALQNQIEGSTGFRVKVSPDGFVTECMITSSSGSSDLDQATCTNVVRRARFDPALDAQGKPISGAYSNRVRWQIPHFALMEAFPRPPRALQYGWTRLLPEDFPKAALDEKRFGEAMVELAISSTGILTNCKIVKGTGHSDLDKASCDISFSRAKFSPAIDVAGLPTEGRIRTSLKWEVKPKSAATLGTEGGTFDLLPKSGTTRLTFIVGKDGSFTDCDGEVTGEIKLDPKLICNARFTQKPYTDKNGRPMARRVTMTSKVELEDLPE